MRRRSPRFFARTPPQRRQSASRLDPSPDPMPIRAILTDIEGTTSSISFVKDVLFP